MPAFRTIRSEVASLRTQETERTGDLRVDAGVLAALVYGGDILHCPSLVNLAALSLAMERLIVHEIAPEVCEQVHFTDVRTLPPDPSRLLRRPFILEVKSPASEALFADVVGLAGYQIGNDWWLVAIRYPDGIMVMQWAPVWGTGEDIPDGLVLTADALVENVQGWEEAGAQSARFAVVLGLLMDAEGTPVDSYDTREAGRMLPRRVAGERPRYEPAWTVRYLRIPPEIIARHRSFEVGGEHGDLTATQSTVRGHLKRQPYGPRNAERKWVYVSAYEARRWVAPKPQIVRVRKA